MTVGELIAKLSTLDRWARVYAEIPTYQEAEDSFYLRHFVAGVSACETGVVLDIDDEPDPPERGVPRDYMICVGRGCPNRRVRGSSFCADHA